MFRPLVLVLVALGFCSPGVIAAEGKRYAVLIGIQKYDNAKLEPLKYTERDMTDLGVVLEDAGYSVTVLTDSTGKKDKALEPTKSNIEKSLKAVLDKAKKEDLILVAFSGHGLRFDGKSEAYICPKDAKPLLDSTSTLLAVDSLCEKLKSSPATGKVLLIDACRNSPKSDLAPGVEGDKVKVPAGVLAMFSCSAGEHSFEHKTLNRGVFFHQIIEGLKGKAGDGNDAITFASLAGYVGKEVPIEAADLVEDGKQTPSIHAGAAGAKSPQLALHPEAIPAAEWKEYEEVWSKGSTEPFLKKYSAKRFASWRKSAEAGSARGMMLLADCTEFGVAGSKDPKEAARWYGKSANLGNSFAMVGFAMCYKRGFGVKKSDKEAAGWYRKSAELGDAGGMHGLGGCYFRGLGVEKDTKEAVRWYRKSAELGFGQAMYSLGTVYLDGDGIDKDEKEAVHWFRKGADMGATHCMISLALCYRSGSGIEMNEKEAFGWFRKAASQGDEDGMNLVANCYMEGIGVEKDQMEGVTWYRKSAELENLVGMVHLGMCYLSGTGITKSRVEAVRWLRKAAERGDPVATRLLRGLVE